MEKDKKNKSLQKQNSFEESIERLEEIVKQLESEEVPLEKAILLFEEGQKLVQFCNQKLEEVKFKVETVVKKDNGFSIKPFDYEENFNDKDNQ